MMTFITSTDFVESARLLDKRRLWKQILEAKQLLQKLDLIDELSCLFKQPIPQSTKDKYTFIRTITKPLKKSKHVAIWSNIEHTTFTWLPREKGVVYFDKIKIGYIYHPIVPLWIGYKDALKYYIHVHNEEFISRGGKSPYKTTHSPETHIVMPPWISTLVPFHKCVLKTKAPSEYLQWADLPSLTNDDFPWNDLYMIK
jgi:hypothetical protein